MKVMIFKFLLVFLWVLGCVESAPHSCVRTARASRTRCTAQCSPSDAAGCPAGHKCLCDGQCGYSCVEQGLQCPVPVPIQNGFLSYKSTRYNDTVKYKCKENYTLNGDKVRRCTAKKSWEGALPFCMPDCGQPKVPRNANIENKKSKYASGDRVTFKCDEGFKQEGIARSLCFMGRWNIVPFRCTSLQCPVPVPIQNGFLSYKSTRYNDTVKYKCKEKYTLHGNKVRRCTAKKRWEGALPFCIPDCGQPMVPRNAYIENKKSKYASGDRVTFKCDEGFNQEGIATTLCFWGRWNVLPFRCATGGCGDPGTPDNGNKVGISYAHGREVFFSCNIGYVRVGSEQRRCLTNNTWSGTQPTCKLLDCGPPRELRNGTIIGSETTFQKSISFKCDEGFKLDGNPTAICQSDGKWSTEPNCQLRTSCRDPGTPWNGIKRKLMHSTGSLVFFACDFGYKLVGSMMRKCLANSQWSGVQPICKQLARDCVQPIPPGNAYIPNKKSRYFLGESVTFKCKEGFSPVGLDTTLCLMGKWTLLPFRCIKTTF